MGTVESVMEINAIKKFCAQNYYWEIYTKEPFHLTV